jgi:alginate O-acetyltransferase complex protein AlgI
LLFTDWKVLLSVLLAWVIYYLPVMRGQQQRLLVVLSVTIYAFEAPTGVALLLCLASLNAWISYRVADFEILEKRRRWAVFGVVLNLFILGFFKYNRMLFELLGHELAADGDVVRAILLLPLPIGISFYTFHGISLLVDTLRADQTQPPPLARHFRDTLLYLCFFPQLVAGPITKAHYFYPQIGPKTLDQIDWPQVVRLLVVGYFLKLVVANNLASHTFLIQYPYFLGLSRNELVVLLFGYSMQIFADFAGYSLIAIGLAALFGYRLTSNFNFPYIASSFSEFWTRWHISLSAWLREYLYFPLGGNRKGKARTCFNLLIVMGLGGLWHGATISYAVWGLWHGLALVLERLVLGAIPWKPSGALSSVARGVLVFLVVTIGWLMFKLPEFTHVRAYLKAIADSSWQPGLSNASRAVLLLSVPVVAYHIHYLLRQRCVSLAWLQQPALAAMVFLIVFNAGPNAAFIYFQF